MAKKVKKRKLNLFKLFIFLMIVAALCVTVYYLFKVKTKNIIIKGNNFYTDKEVIELSGIEDYPSFLKLNTFKIKRLLKKESLTKDVKVKKKLGFVLEIEIIENKVLYQKKSDGLYLLDTGEEISHDKIIGIPLLINYYPNTMNEKALKSFGKLDQEVIYKISSIEYSKTDADDERFLLYMTDGNLVYINLNRMANLNSYTKILNSVGTKKGILNLDSGNYFEVKEK